MSATKPCWVIKIGGAILSNTDALATFLDTLAKLCQQASIVLVHGGGVVVDKMLADAGHTTTKIDGLRVTPNEQMPIISGALAGAVNKTIVARASQHGIAAVGLSLADGNSVHCHPADETLGCVGIPSAQSSVLLQCLLNANFVPVVSSIGALENGTLVNVNADDAAVAIAQLLQAELVLLTDVAGVKGSDGEVIAQLSANTAKSLIQQGVIQGGMVAKVNAALAAASHLRRSIAVASWERPEQIHAMILGQPTGTRILPN